jgi:hypothetical protein
MRIVLRDIFLMDKGDAGATGFKWDEEIVKYRMANEEADEWLVGHIHSHHHMGVFFSGTDMEELNDNAPKHNLYLSVIVNNRLDIKAKVVVYAEGIEQVIKKRYSCKDELGRDYAVDLGEMKVKPQDGMLVYECDILYDKPKIEVDETFIRRIESVIKEKEEKKKEVTKSWVYPSYQSTPGYKSPAISVPYLDKNPEDINVLTKKDLMEAFGGYVLRMGTFVEADTITDALNDIAMANINESAVAYIIEKQYMRMFGIFFMDMGSTARIAIYDEVLKYIIEELLKTDDPSETEIHDAGTLIDCFMEIQKLAEVTTNHY